MSTVQHTAESRTFTTKIGRDDLSNLAWDYLKNLLEEELGKANPEPGSVAAAELCVGIMKAIALKCTRIEIEIEPDSIVSVSPV